MQVQLLAKDSRDFLLDFLKLHRPSKNQDPAHHTNHTEGRIMRRPVPAADGNIHMWRQNLCAESSKYTFAYLWLVLAATDELHPPPPHTPPYLPPFPSSYTSLQ